MPRDDLSIDGSFGTMPQTEHQDCAAVLDEWTNRVANLPAEIAFMQEEIAEKDRLMQECLSIINRNDGQIQKWIKANGSHVPNPKEESLSRAILENYDKAKILQEEKIALAQKTQSVVDKHTRYLDGHIKALQDRGEFPNDPDIPSLLRPQPLPERARLESSVAAMPHGQIANSATIHQRHTAQQPRVPPVHPQIQQMGSGAPSSVPNTPAASLLLNRLSRESSLPAAKRQRLGQSMGQLPPSGLARHASLTPGTPRAGTPSSVRGASTGPRPPSQRTSAATKRVGPQANRPGAVGRKRPGKSSLSRLNYLGKNSPSSTNDSELSEAETGSVDEDDVATPPRKDGDGYLDMMDPDDDEEGVEGDDKKYCMCQSVSYGDMVACDNESCPYEWFHWSCVGLKSEPVGTWICPICVKNMKK